MKLNIACGRNVKEGFINVDQYERENKLDVICDVTKEWPWKHNTCDYIYAEQFIEHLTWLDCKVFIMNCYRTLKSGGILRLVLPHYKKIFQKYLDGDNEFFEPYYKALNKSDYDYYYEIYTHPETIKEERKDNPPPDWHFSKDIKDRKRVEERIRFYSLNIEIVERIIFQYQEHKCLYDYDSLEALLFRTGFSKIYETDIKEIDSQELTRKDFSLYVEAIK